ncbi:MAG: helix-turn-helix domain-containing protein [Desulfococcaceae bacterium]
MMGGTACIQGLFPPSVELANFLDGIPVGILIMDTDRRVVTLNRQIREWTGASPSAAGHPCWEVVNHSLCRENCPVPAMAPADDIRRMEGSMERSDTFTLPLSVAVCPIRDAGGRIVGFLESMMESNPREVLPSPEGERGWFRSSAGQGPSTRNSSFEKGSETETPTWEEVERRLILDALVRSGGKRKEAAVILGWSRSTLWRKMKARGVVE